jgi:hypothetical protein
LSCDCCEQQKALPSAVEAGQQALTLIRAGKLWIMGGQANLADGIKPTWKAAADAIKAANTTVLICVRQEMHQSAGS